MKIEDLVKLLGCQRGKALQRTNIIMSYLLFRVSLCGEDEIPGVGVLTISEDSKEAIIKLDERWVNLLQGGSCAEEFLEYLMRVIVG